MQQQQLSISCTLGPDNVNPTRAALPLLKQAITVEISSAIKRLPHLAISGTSTNQILNSMELRLTGADINFVKDLFCCSMRSLDPLEVAVVGNFSLRITAVGCALPILQAAAGVVCSQALEEFDAKMLACKDIRCKNTVAIKYNHSKHNSWVEVECTPVFGEQGHCELCGEEVNSEASDDSHWCKAGGRMHLLCTMHAQQCKVTSAGVENFWRYIGPRMGVDVEKWCCVCAIAEEVESKKCIRCAHDLAQVPPPSNQLGLYEHDADDQSCCMEPGAKRQCTWSQSVIQPAIVNYSHK